MTKTQTPKESAMKTREELVRWLENAGHAGFAEDLALAGDEETAAYVARCAADEMTENPHYDDESYRDLVYELRIYASRA